MQQSVHGIKYRISASKDSSHQLLNRSGKNITKTGVQLVGCTHCATVDESGCMEVLDLDHWWSWALTYHNVVNFERTHAYPERIVARPALHRSNPDLVRIISSITLSR